MFQSTWTQSDLNQTNWACPMPKHTENHTVSQRSPEGYNPCMSLCECLRKMWTFKWATFKVTHSFRKQSSKQPNQTNPNNQLPKCDFQVLAFRIKNNNNRSYGEKHRTCKKRPTPKRKKDREREVLYTTRASNAIMIRFVHGRCPWSLNCRYIANTTPCRTTPQISP